MLCSVCVDYVRSPLPPCCAPAFSGCYPLCKHYSTIPIGPSVRRDDPGGVVLQYYTVLPSFRQCPVVYISVPCRCVCVRPPRSVWCHGPWGVVTIILYWTDGRTNVPRNGTLRYVWLFVCSARSATSVLIRYVRSHGHGWRGVCVPHRLLLFFQSGLRVLMYVHTVGGGISSSIE